MNVGIYLRLSMADGDMDEKDKKESNSIENQRLLLQDYILKNPDLYGEVIEYVDDGYTGTNFNRPAFQQMITDAQNGLIQVILAKDLSRLGRNYVEMGDYLDQIFPRLGIRVIAIGSGYDSNDHLGDVSGMDAAITNFINTMYSRDLSVRIKSIHKSLIKNGTPVTSLLPYGYRRDPKNKRGWIPDEDTADFVRLIFQKAAAGEEVIGIVNYLNGNHVKLPGDRMEELYHFHPRKIITDEEYLWDTGKVCSIIRNYCYVGACVVNKSETSLFSSKKVRRLPKEEWITIENHHEPLVDKETFEKAQAAIRSISCRDRKREAIYALKKKLRCGNCHRAVVFRENKETFYCAHKDEAGRYSNCCKRYYSYSETEAIVLKQLKRYLSDLKWLDALARNAIGLVTPTYEGKKKDNSSRIAILKAERVRQYEGYAAGLITKEAYLRKKEELTAQIEQLEAEMREINEKVRNDAALLQDIDKMSKKSAYVIDSPVLTQYIVDQFIKNVYVHDYDRIEIVYKTDELYDRTVTRNNEIMDALSPKEWEETSHPYNSRYVRILRENNLMEKKGKENEI